MLFLFCIVSRSPLSVNRNFLTSVISRANSFAYANYRMRGILLMTRPDMSLMINRELTNSGLVILDNLSLNCNQSDFWHHPGIVYT